MEKSSLLNLMKLNNIKWKMKKISHDNLNSDNKDQIKQTVF